jgi:hypothetical protein
MLSDHIAPYSTAFSHKAVPLSYLSNPCIEGIYMGLPLVHAGGSVNAHSLDAATSDSQPSKVQGSEWQLWLVK